MCSVHNVINDKFHIDDITVEELLLFVRGLYDVAEYYYRFVHNVDLPVEELLLLGCTSEC